MLNQVFTSVPEMIFEEAGETVKSKKSKYHGLIKGYVAEIQKFIGEDSTASPDGLDLALAGLPRWIPLLANFPESRKKIVERLISIWANQTSDKARLSSLLAIHKAVSTYPKLVESVLKKMYSAFGKACRSLSVHTLGTATFLLNGLVEIFSIDADKSAAVTKKALRQLAASLQTAIKHPSKDSLGAVYCWSFVWNLKFLARFVATQKKGDALQSEVLSVIHASLCYNFVPRFYAFHFHLIGAANEVCRTNGVFFPSTPFLLATLRRIGQTATKPETGKPKVFDFTTICKVPKVESGARSYLDCAAEEALFLIGEALMGFGLSPAFPDYAEPIVAQLKAIEAQNKTWKVAKLCSTLAMKLDQHSKNIIAARNELPGCAPAKLAVDKVELASEKDILDQFHKHSLRVREQRRKLVASNTDNKTYVEPEIDEDDVKEATNTVKAAKNKAVAKKQPAKRKSEEATDELAEGVRAILKKNKKSLPTEDIVEDFDLSDF